MTQNDSGAVTAQVTEILLTNGSFYRQSPTDRQQYLLDLAALGALAYQIIEFAANVFGAVLPVAAGIRWVYRRYFPAESAGKPADPAKSDSVPPLAPAELKAKLEQLKANAQDPTVRGQLEGDVTKILQYHGWPATEADADARRIVETLVTGVDKH